MPADCEKISTEWLSHAVHAEVTGFKTRVCSEGQVAITVVLHDIEYAAPRDDRPSSLAIKMHPADEGARQFGYISGLFSQELYFYTSFCDKLPGIVWEAQRQAARLRPLSESSYASDVRATDDAESDPPLVAPTPLAMRIGVPA